MNRKRRPRFAGPLATFAVAVVFLFTSVATSFAFCPCGVFCGPEKKVAAVEDEHSCCGSQDDTAPPPAEEGCPCDEIVTSATPDLPDMVASHLRLMVPDAAVVMIPAAVVDIHIVAVPAHILSAPTRGSPLPRPPAHLLHESILI